MNRTENLWQINCRWRIWESCYDEFYFKSLMLYMNVHITGEVQGQNSSSGSFF